MSEHLKVLVVAAHPDEADMYAGGTAALLADAGHFVKFLSLTNGDAGHYEMARKPLAHRRAEEAYEAARLLNVAEYEILEHHDGELEPSFAIRKEVIASIREWQSDLVISFHDECARHSDNRAAGRLTRDAVEFSTLRNVVPNRPPLRRSPVCLLMTDYGAADHHRHDVAVDVDNTIEQKLRACAAHATQFLENAPHGRGFLDRVPVDGSWSAQRDLILEFWPEFMYTQDDMRDGLAEVYGPGAADDVEFAETFQLADYGRTTTAAEVVSMLGLEH